MKLPPPVHANTTAAAILRHHETRVDRRRLHLGVSEIGGPCDRALWYSFRWASMRTYPGRVLRLFETGNLAEARFVKELRAIGCEIHAVDPETGRQHSFSAVGGHFGGSCDAVGRGMPEGPKTWAILEFKTHNAKSFGELVKNGVKESKPEHWTQMQCYMGFAELDRALYLAVNKDNDDIHSEWIHYEAQAFEDAKARAARIIKADEPPTRISEDPAWFQCRFCPHAGVCHGETVPPATCRSCAHSTPVKGGWRCGVTGDMLAPAAQEEGCASHLYIPPLIPYADAVDAKDAFVIYRTKDGVEFANSMNGEGDGLKVPAYSSAELAARPPSVLLAPDVIAAKLAFPGCTIDGIHQREPSPE